MAKSNFIVRGGADFSGIKKELDKTQKQLQGFRSNISNSMKMIGRVLGSLAIGKLIKDSTQVAMGVETAMENINHNMGQSAGAFQNWVNTQSKALGMAKADAYSYGSTFSNLLSSFTSGAKETADQTQELMKAAAIIASKTGRTYDDTANRIRSGMLGSTEAIEDLGVYTNISMIESTEAFRKFAGDKSWAQLDFQTQQQIRLAAILEQTYARYGDALADNTQTRHAQFVASLKNIQLSLGQAFLPIYNAVLPALTAMANAISRVVGYIAQFVTALFGAPKQAQAQANAVQNQASAMTDLGKATTGAGKAAKRAAKEAKSLAGFDEINKLAQPSASGGSDGGGGAPSGVGGGAISMPAFDTGGFASATVEVSEKIQAMADKVKRVLSDLKDFLLENKTSIISIVAGIATGIGSYFLITNWPTIVATIKGAMTVIGGAISGISWPIIAVATLIGLVVAAVVDLWQTNDNFRNKIIEAWNGIKDSLNKVWKTVIKPIFEAIKDTALEIWNKGIKPLWGYFKDFVGAIIVLLADMWLAFKPVFDWLVKTFGPVIVDMFKRLLNNIKNIILLIVDVVGSVIGNFQGIINGIKQIFGGLIDFVAGVFTGDWRRVWNGIKNIFSGVKTSISNVWGGIKNIFTTIINYVKGAFANSWRSAWNGIKNTFNSLTGTAKSVWASIKNVFANIPNWFKSKFTQAWTNVKNVFSSGGKIFTGIKDGIASTFRTIVNGLINGINRVIRTPFNAINRMLNTIRSVSVLGIKPFSSLWGYNPLRVPQIPKLATGGYVGANNPMLAVIGDNRMEGEIVAPESKIYEQTLRAIRDTGGSNIELTIQLGSTKIYHEIINGINQTQRQAGKTLITL